MAKNKSKKKGKKVAGGVGVVAVLAAILFFGGRGLGLGGGGGFGFGKDVSVNSDAENQTEDENEPVEEKKDEVPEEKPSDETVATVLIEVKQGQYLIDGAEKSLADIEALLTAEDAANTSFTLENNYASAKAWDEIKALFTRYEIAVTEQ